MATLTALSLRRSYSPIFSFFSASGCRFYCRFPLPLLVAVWQAQIVLWYAVDANWGSVKIRGLFFYCSLLTAHCSLFTREALFESQRKLKRS
jgi:hypothetical protein